MANVDARLKARVRRRIRQIGDNSRIHAPGDNLFNSKTVNMSRNSRICSANTNITISTGGGEVVIEKLYLVLDRNDYWKMGASS